jgi:hypothetical protein
VVGRDERSVILSAWSDIRTKAVRLRNGGNITIKSHNDMVTEAQVVGDHGVYAVQLFRTDPDSVRITKWSCECKWGVWAWRRVRHYVGRCCSHALACFYEAQSLDYVDITNLDTWNDDPVQTVMRLDPHRKQRGPRGW